MDTELENKHSEKYKLKKEIKKICVELTRSLSLIILNTVVHQMCVVVESWLKNSGKRHDKKLFNLHKQQQINQSSNEKFNNDIKSTVHNFSLFQFSDDELTALSYGLDHHIPNKLNCNRIHTESEQFYQNLLKDISHFWWQFNLVNFIVKFMYLTNINRLLTGSQKTKAFVFWSKIKSKKIKNKINSIRISPVISHRLKPR